MPLSLLEPTSVDGCISLVFKDFTDVRGVFSEAFNHDDFMAAGLPTLWTQDNLSISGENVLRGLHTQRVRPQGKLIRCFRGIIYDVCLDLRANSPTFMKWHGQYVTENKGLYCPPGTAHGFLALHPTCVVYYKCTSLYHAESDGGVNPFDEEVNIPWNEIRAKPKTVSTKDMALPSMREWLTMGEPK